MSKRETQIPLPVPAHSKYFIHELASHSAVRGAGGSLAEREMRERVPRSSHLRPSVLVQAATTTFTPQMETAWGKSVTARLATRKDAHTHTPHECTDVRISVRMVATNQV